MEVALTITVDNVSDAQANKLVADMKAFLLRNNETSSNIIKEDIETMDFGTTLILLMGTSSIVAIAEGLGTWLKKQQNRTITITTHDKKVVGRNLGSGDVERILKDLKL